MRSSAAGSYRSSNPAIASSRASRSTSRAPSRAFPHTPRRFGFPDPNRREHAPRWPPSPGTVSFLIRLFLLGLGLLVALRTAGLEPRTLAVGGAFTAVIIGLAAQNTLGNVLAGLLLLTARPFRVGDRVRFQAGGLAGQVEGVVMSLGLIYVTLAQGEDTIMIPNNVAMASAVVPLREPASVNLLARLKPDVKPSELQRFLEEKVTVPTRSLPHIAVEEVDDSEVIMRVFATPELDREGPKLADEIIAAIGEVTGRDSGSSNRNGDSAPVRASA